MVHLLRQTPTKTHTPRTRAATASWTVAATLLLVAAPVLAGPLDDAFDCRTRPVNHGCSAWAFSSPDGFVLQATAAHPDGHTFFQSGPEGSGTRVTGLTADGGDHQFNIRLSQRFEHQALAATTDGTEVLLAGSKVDGTTKLVRLEPLFGLHRGTVALPAIGNVAEDGLRTTADAALVIVEDVRADPAGDLAIVRIDLTTYAVTETVVGAPGLADAPQAVALDESGAHLVLAYQSRDDTQALVELVVVDTTTLAIQWTTTIPLAADVVDRIDVATAGSSVLLLAPDATRAYSLADGTPAWSRTHSGAGLPADFVPAALVADVVDTDRVVIAGDAPGGTSRDVAAAALVLQNGTVAWSDQYAGPGIDGEDRAVDVVLASDGAQAIIVLESQGTHITTGTESAGHGKDVTILSLTAASGIVQWQQTTFDQSLPQDSQRLLDTPPLDEEIHSVRVLPGQDMLVVGTNTYKDAFTTAFQL